METEIKTLVYRDRASEPGSPKKQPKLNIAIIITAILCAVVLTTGIIVTKMNSKDALDVATEVQPTDDEVTAKTVTYNHNINLKRYNVAKNEQLVLDHCKMVDTLETEENTESAIMLLAASEEDLFIPMFEGAIDDMMSDTDAESIEGSEVSAEADAAVEGNAEETNGKTYEGRLEEVEDLTSKILAPDDSPSSLTYKYNENMKLGLTDREIEILERIVEAEATDQDVYGRMLVANVVINRVNSKYFANTVEGVVFEKIGSSYQFSPIKDGRYYTVPVTDKTREAVSRVLDGEDYSQGALYFFERRRTTSGKASWFDKNLKYLFKYGCHEFFTEFAK